MPVKAPRLCACGFKVPSGARCKCEARQDAERKARFDAKRPTSSQRGYSGTWDKARAGYLAANPYCRRCGEPASVVDHIRPHRGDKALFWDKTNWQPLCTPCHSGTKQREERKMKR
jgi:5-methylcytosine-specific restriction endonuclease McrA